MNNTRLMAIFQDDLGKHVQNVSILAFIGAKDKKEVMVTTGATRCVKLQSNLNKKTYKSRNII